ncbi:MAG: hypothetical protein AAF907_09160, partial [Planctomycetota bacterium]
PTAAAQTEPKWSRDDPGPGVLHAFGTLAELSPSLPTGVSGGGLFNESGKLLGLLVEPPAGAALPPRVVPLTGSFRRIVEALIAGKAPGYGLLGVDPGTVTADGAVASLGENAPPGAALLVDVREDSPAERAGLRRGEWIVGLTDAAAATTPIESASDLMRAIALSPPGATVSLAVLNPRTGERRSASVTLAAAATGRAAGGWPEVRTVPRGLSVRNVRVDWATTAALTPPGEPLPRGVIVLQVDQNALPPDDGDRPLRTSDRIVAVGETMIDSPADFAAAVGDRTGPVAVRLADGTTAVLP